MLLNNNNNNNTFDLIYTFLEVNLKKYISGYFEIKLGHPRLKFGENSIHIALNHRQYMTTRKQTILLSVRDTARRGAFLKGPIKMMDLN